MPIAVVVVVPRAHHCCYHRRRRAESSVGDVGVNDGGRFGTGGDGWLRINIGCPRKILEVALKRLGKAYGKM